MGIAPETMAEGVDALDRILGGLCRAEVLNDLRRVSLTMGVDVSRDGDSATACYMERLSDGTLAVVDFVNVTRA